MPTPADPSPDNNTYVIDSDSATEMARLMHQHRLLTEGMGGLFPEGCDLSNIHDILDIACGPGGWVLDVAHEYPKKQAMGIDINQKMVEYARAQARAQGLDNASFRVMDALKPLDFPDSSFDLINCRFLFGFMLPAAWPKLLQECLRITRPGGIISLSETEYSITNSFACERLGGLFTHALQLAGQSFSPDGRNIGITPMLGRFLREVGYQNIQKTAHVVDYSAGMEAHMSTYQDLMIGLKMVEPFLIKLGVTTEEEADRLYQQALAEMHSDDFCGIFFSLTVSGKKP